MARINDQGFDVERLERVTGGVRSDVENGRCHGVAMIVARGGKIVLDVTEGYADKAAGRRLGKDAVFVSMSVAKQFTNVMALSLVERGALRLHAPVAELIPAFGALGKEKVNLYHLFTHTSGLQSAIPAVSPEVLTSIEKSLDYACGLPLESLPGERVNYSILLAHHVIAALCLRAAGNGRTFAQMMNEEIFQPIIFGKGVTSAKPGSVELVLAVDELDDARDDLIARGINVSEVFHYAGGPFNNATKNPRVAGRDPEGRSYFSFASFEDPDGNRWLLQEIKERLPGREWK